MKIFGASRIKFETTSRNIPKNLYEFLIREKPSRAWPRSAAPHRSLPHVSRTVGHACRRKEGPQARHVAPSLCSSKKKRCLSYSSLRGQGGFAPAQQPVPSGHHAPSLCAACWPLPSAFGGRTTQKIIALAHCKELIAGGHRLNKTPPRRVRAGVGFSVIYLSPPAGDGNGNSKEAKAGTARPGRADPALAASYKAIAAWSAFGISSGFEFSVWYNIAGDSRLKRIASVAALPEA